MRQATVLDRDGDDFRSPYPRDVHSHEKRCVPLQGIRQIPEAVTTFWNLSGHDQEPPPGLKRMCDDAIREAMEEHRRRREALKLGMDLDEYFVPGGAAGGTRADDEEDED